MPRPSSAQPRRPAGTPIGGQFAPANRPEASGLELAEDGGESVSYHLFLDTEHEPGSVDLMSMRDGEVSIDDTFGSIQFGPKPVDDDDLHRAEALVPDDWDIDGPWDVVTDGYVLPLKAVREEHA